MSKTNGTEIGPLTKVYYGIAIPQIASVGAGLFAGACGVVLGHPLDTLKVRLQTGQNLDLHKLKGFDIVKQLYRGIAPPIFTAGIMQSMNFTIYEGAKKYAKVNWNYDHLSAVFFGGALSGFVISFLTSPISVVKVQQQIRTTKGMIGCMKDIYQIHGWRAFYRSFHLITFMESYGRGVYLWIYEAAKLELQSNKTFRQFFSNSNSDNRNNCDSSNNSNSSNRKDINGDPPSEVPERVIAAATAGMMSWLVVYPLDVMKSKLQVDLYRQQYKGVIECFSKTYAEFGFRGFWKGIGFTMIRAAPVAATILPVYELTKAFIVKELS